MGFFCFSFFLVYWLNIGSVKLHPLFVEVACLMFYFGIAVSWRPELLWNYSRKSGCWCLSFLHRHTGRGPWAAVSTVSCSHGAVPRLWALGLEGAKLLNQSRCPAPRQAGCQWLNLVMWRCPSIFCFVVSSKWHVGRGNIFHSCAPCSRNITHFWENL